jgi:hypothetical protein
MTLDPITVGVSVVARVAVQLLRGGLKGMGLA